HLLSRFLLFPYTTLFRSMAALVDNLYMKAGNEFQKAFESIKGVNFSAFGLQLSANISKPTFSIYQGILTNMFDKLKKKGIKHIRSEEHTSELQSRFDLVC